MRNTLRKPLLHAFAAAAIAVGAATTPANAEESFIFAHPMNVDHVFHAISERYMAALADNADVALEYHPGGDLGDWTSLFEQAMQGVVPMTLTWASSDFDKRLDLIYLGYIVSNWEEAKTLYGPGAGMLDVYNDMLHDLGIHAVGIIPTDFGSVVIRKGVGKLPMSFPDEPAGMKIRVPGLSIAVGRFNSFGFAAVPIPLSEVHTALQLGTVDARSFSTAVETYTLRDVLEANILTNDYFEVAFWLVNKAWWDGLDDGVRTALQAAADDSIAWSWAEAERKSDEFLQKAREAGINVVDLSDEQMSAAKQLVYEKEWPAMESVVGKDIMDQIRSIVGVE